VPPLGATPGADGVNFSVFSRHATGIELLLFDGVDDAQPTRVIPIDPAANRTYHYGHVFAPDVRPGQLYAPGSPRPWSRTGPIASRRAPWWCCARPRAGERAGREATAHAKRSIAACSGASLSRG
jgi:hypothetical protein